MHTSDSNRADSFWTANDRARLTKNFIGIGYTEVEVRIIAIAKNAVEVTDATGRKRIIQFKDCSYASEYVARDNIGAIITLKIRAWT
jgi:hypothetical protein